MTSRGPYLSFLVMEKIRSFIAVDIPSLLRERFAVLQDELRQTRADVKWTRPEGIHLTLKFLGSVSPEDLDKIGSAVAPAVLETKKFHLRVQGTGSFPSERNPRVVWIGIREGVEEITRLQRLVDEKAAEAGFPPETRPFTPHLTLGRVRSSKGKPALTAGLERNREIDFGDFGVGEVCLFRSDLRPSGAIYTTLKVFPMSAF
jgi:RNA 2',3'-cyclic 3'-phosphodiesterase